MGNSFQPMKTGNSRTFLIEDRAGPSHRPAYESCLVPQGLTKAFGDIEKIECPDPYRYGQWVEVGTIQGQEGRTTIDLVGKYALDLASDVLRLAQRRCAIDIQLHLGACKDPTDFLSFDKAIILENAYLTNWSTAELGALGSDGNATVDETISISAEDIYEVLQLSVAEKAGSIVTNEVQDVVICGGASCGECTTSSTGCDHIYAVTKGAGGSGGTPPDIVFSVDGGKTWCADDIDAFASAEDADGIACLGDYLVAISVAACSLAYADKSQVDDPDYDETWVEVTTGFVATKCPRDIWSVGSVAFIAAWGGYIYLLENVTAGVTVLDAGVLTNLDFLAVHALSEQNALVVGNDGAIAYTETGTSWAVPTTSPVGVGTNLLACWMKSKTCWFVGDSAGQLWYTLDAGEHWTLKQDFGAAVYDIAFSTDSVGYVAVATATPKGQIWRTYDGGYSWTALPEGVGAMPGNDRIIALAVCQDPNFVVGVGLGDNGTDGFIVVAED